MIIPPEAIIPLSPKIQSAAAVRAAVGFDDHVAMHPHQEIFVLWFRQDPANPFAVVMRIPKPRIAKDGWPLIVDADTRVVAFEAPARD